MDKKMYAWGICDVEFATANEARGMTYTTRDDEFFSTPLAFPDNPFNEDVLKAKYILDIGCGVGRNLEWVMQNTDAIYVGVDPNPTMLGYFWDVQDSKWKDRTILVPDLESLPPSIVFDVVVVTFVFQHIGYRPSEECMNVGDITQQALTKCSPTAVWILYEHDGEEKWIERWMSENNIAPQVYRRDYGGIEKLTHRGLHHLIIWKRSGVVQYTGTEYLPPELELNDLVIDYAEYSNQPIAVVADKVLNFATNSTEAQNRLGDAFYSTADSYVYDNISANRTPAFRATLIKKFIPNFLPDLKKFPERKTFADFGAGIGVMCQIACGYGKDVDYVDLHSVSSDFAEWRNKKYGFGYNMVIIQEDDFVLPRTYDTIFTDAVWEHLPPEKQITYLDKLVSYLNPGGVLYLLIDLSGVSEVNPIHYNVNIWEVHQTLENAKMTCVFGRNTFASEWHK